MAITRFLNLNTAFKKVIFYMLRYIQLIRHIKLCLKKTDFPAEIYTSDAMLYLTGYTVNNEGFIELPALGDIHVTGLTIRQAQLAVQEGAESLFQRSTGRCKAS
jgi:protein involved in polysaccharide export with SLBB domain